MSGPLIVMTTWRVKEGRLEGFKQFITRLLELVQAREPRMIGFNLFLDEEGSEVTSMQIHPDADSMDNHMQLIGELLGEEMQAWVDRADFLELKRIEIYGNPSAALLEADREQVEAGIPRTIKPRHVAGFIRSTAG